MEAPPLSGGGGLPSERPPGGEGEGEGEAVDGGLRGVEEGVGQGGGPVVRVPWGGGEGARGRLVRGGGEGFAPPPGKVSPTSVGQGPLTTSDSRKACRRGRTGHNGGQSSVRGGSFAGGKEGGVRGTPMGWPFSRDTATPPGCTGVTGKVPFGPDRPTNG